MQRNGEYWDKVYKNIKDKDIIFDLWLEKFQDILEKHKNDVILDLGCGSGADSLYLVERGYRNIIACDNSEKALEIVKRNITNIKVLNVDVSYNIPFENESIGMIIADLSLHYFNEETTKNILKEIKRILKDDGVFICRVNSLNDFNYGASEGKEIEKHFYLTNVGYKRFFNEDDINHFFSDWKVKYCKEDKMCRYGAEKRSFEVVSVK
ncbi:class I SAM-dependent methyltransferase [Clostridium botulinum]|nr:class I SAM-dependent methyltransferase [Clostridium botulinum]